MITGEFSVLAKMQNNAPIFTPIYFLGFMIVTVVFLANIFIGMISGTFYSEMRLFERECKDEA